MVEFKREKRGVGVTYKITNAKHKKYIKEFYSVTKFLVAVIVIALFLGRGSETW